MKVLSEDVRGLKHLIRDYGVVFLAINFRVFIRGLYSNLKLERKKRKIDNLIKFSTSLTSQDKGDSNG